VRAGRDGQKARTAAEHLNARVAGGRRFLCETPFWSGPDRRGGWREGRPPKAGAPPALFHKDSYVLTAAPAVVCLNQYLTGAIRRTGLHWQANLVQLAAFVQDLQRMGLTAEVKEFVN
jgi:hypothetical protein